MSSSAIFLSIFLFFLLIALSNGYHLYPQLLRGIVRKNKGKESLRHSVSNPTSESDKSQRINHTIKLNEDKVVDTILCGDVEGKKVLCR